MKKKLQHIELNLSQDESYSLATALSEIGSDPSIKTEGDIFSFGQRLVKSFPERLLRALKDISKNKSEAVSLIVHNLPVKRPNGFSKNDKNSELVLAALAYSIGPAFVATNHRDGKALLDLIPKKVDAGKQLSTGVELEWHTEDAHLSHPARFICLLGLREDAQAKTLISDINISTVDKELSTLLSARGYIIQSDESYSKNHKENTSLISEGKNDLYHLRYDPSFTEFVSREYDDASQQLQRLLDQNHKEFQLETGDLLIFNNKIASHKRSNFNPSYSETDRWVQRIMLS